MIKGEMFSHHGSSVAKTAPKTSAEGDPSRQTRNDDNLLSSAISSPEVRWEPPSSFQDAISREKRISMPSVHFGSYLQTSEPKISSRRSSRHSSVRDLPSRNQSQEHLDLLLPKEDVDLETYGIQELRDGFFDASFHRPLPRNREEMRRKASETLPSALQTHHPLSLEYFIPRQWSEVKDVVFHEALKSISEGLVFPRADDLSLRRALSWHFVRLSTAVRDFTIEVSISRYDPEDVRSTRNLLQSVIRASLSIKPDTELFNILPNGKKEEGRASKTDANKLRRQGPPGESTQLMLEAVALHIADPTRDVILAMAACITSCDAVVTDIGGQHTSIHPSQSLPDLYQSIGSLSAAITSFDAADAVLVTDPTVPSRASTIPEVVSLFLFVHPVRQAADKVLALSEKVLQMQQRRRHWTPRLPSYPFHKQFNRTNAQVRHDRGGLTAGFYFRTKAQLDRTMADLQSRRFIPTSRHDVPHSTNPRASIADGAGNPKNTTSEPKLAQAESKTLRFKIWEILHRMQGFESRFALKIVLVTTLLSVPAWLEQSREWWNTYESWWTVVTVWLMTHPRVSGTFQDLAARLICVALGAMWGGLAHAAGSGNPYVMAVFAAIFMVPMMHRYTQSPHPRSGVIGCISFTVISLSALANGSRSSTVTIAWTRGLAFGVAILASILTNWIMWPFVARHELRKSLSAMMLHLAILYRGVVSKYIYYDQGHEPSVQDIERSEMLEVRLREGFVRIRQLMELTRHEIVCKLLSPRYIEANTLQRLRAPFDPLPYSALIEVCERFFEHLVEVRQSSLYFQPSLRAASPSAKDSLISYRRDAVAVILMNLYILASALRARQPVPRYLPSAAAARQKLIDRMEEIEAEHPPGPVADGRETRRWADVYRFAFSSALTDIVEQLQQLQRYTREITGDAVSTAADIE
ncbi:MAG: hypothetical protein Q9170_001718 [Blastenia crenularia]